MIHTTLHLDNSTEVLTNNFQYDTQPLRDYAGFEPTSQCSGQARQTFTLPLSRSTLTRIHASVQVLYDQLIADCWPKGEVLPFDMVRFDAFLDSDGTLSIIELNTRSVGLHEIVEWLDEITATQLGVEFEPSLNRNFVQNQKMIHDSHVDAASPLLFMSHKAIPVWKYYDQLVLAYSSVKHVTNPQSYSVDTLGLTVDGITYRSIARKFSWKANQAILELADTGAISIVQPMWMRHYGHKDYLLEMDSPAILGSTLFDTQAVDQYIADKDQLVLKIINAGGSKSVYLGPSCNDEQWRGYLMVAAQSPEHWVLQQFKKPQDHTVIAHGHGARTMPIQLGIFVLPDPLDPKQFSLDIVVKGYAGSDSYFTFDPSGINPDIWFGNVLIT